MARPKLLSPEVVYEIRRLYNEENYTQVRLAEKYDVSQSTICKIVNQYIHRKIVGVSMSGNAGVKVGYALR
jgi:DNA-binding transcriptional regulator LsrR (DeoR family)